MRLLRTSELSSRFEKRLEWASEVDIAVAWVTSCDAVAALIESAADTKVRIAVGLSGNATDPSALESLADTEGVALRIAKPPRNGIFHWKYYCFRRAGEATCWVGSANLTRAGFHCNEEVVHEFHAGEAEARQWFEDLWRTLDRDPTGAIAEYGERYKPPGRSPTAAEPPADEPHRPGVSFGEWSDFVRGLRARDEYCHYVVRHHDPFPQPCLVQSGTFDRFRTGDLELPRCFAGRLFLRWIERLMSKRHDRPAVRPLAFTFRFLTWSARSRRVSGLASKATWQMRSNGSRSRFSSAATRSSGRPSASSSSRMACLRSAAFQRLRKSSRLAKRWRNAFFVQSRRDSMTSLPFSSRYSTRSATMVAETPSTTRSSSRPRGRAR